MWKRVEKMWKQTEKIVETGRNISGNGQKKLRKWVEKRGIGPKNIF